MGNPVVNPGDRVRVVATHVGIVAATTPEGFTIRKDGGKLIVARFGPDVEVEVLRPPPPHWPPEPGQVWAAGEWLWAVGPGDVLICLNSRGSDLPRWQPLASLDQLAPDFHLVYPPGGGIGLDTEDE